MEPNEPDSTLPSPPPKLSVLFQPGHVLAGRYRVDSPIGQGGMGAVFAAIHINTGLPVAIKVLLPEHSQREDLVRRFAAEARAAAALRHPGIVRVTDFDSDGIFHFLVMERLEGESLGERLSRSAAMPEQFVASIGADICDAIGAAHRCNPKIIHRDLKPQNVFLAREGRREDVVKILDFGVAKLIESERIGRETLTTTGALAGTPCYMAPEQLLSAKDVDERSDLYSIGVILFQALTKRLPHDAGSLAELILKVHKYKERPPRLRALRPNVSAGLAALVEKALSRERAERFQSADEMRAALEPFSGTAVPLVAVARPAHRLPSRALVAASAAGLLVAGGLGLWLARRTDGWKPALAPPMPLEAAELSSAAPAPNPLAAPAAFEAARATALPAPSGASPVAPLAAPAHDRPEPTGTAAPRPKDAGKKSAPARAPRPALTPMASTQPPVRPPTYRE